MTVHAAYQNLLSALRARHSEGESKSIVRIVFEDAFSVYNFRREDSLTESQVAHFEGIKTRLINGEPVQYILGQADFYGLQLEVNPSVLIPRPETEELVFWIEETIKDHPHLRKILDIGTGSGCIPLALKKRLPHLQIHALEISEAALQVARRNAEKYSLEIEFFRADILDKNAQKDFGMYDLIVSNPPYIPLREKGLMPVQVLEHEPHLALFTTDANPLIFYCTIGDFAREHLRPGGRLFFECNEFNAEEVRDLSESAGFSETEIRRDMQGKDRMVRARNFR